MMDENASVDKLRQENQPKYADDIREAISIGFHLKCLRCGAVYYHTQFAMSEMGYRMYSYCPECISKGIEALKAKDEQEKLGRRIADIKERVFKGLRCHAYPSDEYENANDEYRHIPKSCRQCPFFFPENPMGCSERLARMVLEYMGDEPPCYGQTFSPD